MKRIVSFFLALLLVLSALTTLAEDGFELFEDDSEWEDFDEDFEDFGDEEEWEDLEDLDEEEAKEMEDEKKNSMNSLSGYNLDLLEEGDFKAQALEDGVSCQALRYTGYDEDVAVPETLKGLTVTQLYQTFSDSNIVETVIIPETVEIIDNMTFWKCINLTHVEIPEGVTTLGRCSFGGCSALESIDFPESLETVDDMVFIGCVELKELKFGKNLKKIGSQAFVACVNLEKVTVPRGTEIAEDAFEQCAKIGEVEYYDP